MKSVKILKHAVTTPKKMFTSQLHWLFAQNADVKAIQDAVYFISKTTKHIINFLLGSTLKVFNHKFISVQYNSYFMMCTLYHKVLQVSFEMHLGRNNSF